MEDYIVKINLEPQMELVTMFGNKRGWVVKVDTHQDRDLSRIVNSLCLAANRDSCFVTASDLHEALCNICELVIPVTNPSV